MGKTIRTRERLGQLLASVIALSAVTAAYYLLPLLKTLGSRAVVTAYFVSAGLMIAGSFAVFRRVVRRAYARSRELSLLPFFLQLLIWGLYFAIPCMYNPSTWAWSGSSVSRAVPLLWATGWACVWAGLLIVVAAMVSLGLPASCGHGGHGLNTSGLYHLSRNPQLVGGALVVIGYVALWPSLYAPGWAVLYAVLTRMMVRTEEEHLRNVHGAAFVEYCRRVPRYVGFRGK